MPAVHLGVFTVSALRRNAAPMLAAPERMVTEMAISPSLIRHAADLSRVTLYSSGTYQVPGRVFYSIPVS